MNQKTNFKIKRDEVDANKIPVIKDTYKRISKEKRKFHKDEPFVLLFRNFLFYDVKSYECHNGDLYIRNIVDGIVLKRYFRMYAEDQLTVFKNREEFDEFMKKAQEKGYQLGPERRNEEQEFDVDFILDNYIGLRDSVTGEIDCLKSEWNGVIFERESDPEHFDKIVNVLENNKDRAEFLTKYDYM